MRIEKREKKLITSSLAQWSSYIGQAETNSSGNIYFQFKFAANDTVFDRDARRSGPIIHFVGMDTLLQNLL